MYGYFFHLEILMAGKIGDLYNIDIHQQSPCSPIYSTAQCFH